MPTALGQRLPNERRPKTGRNPADESRVSNVTHTPTFSNVKAGAAKKATAVRQRLGVVRIRSLRTMSSPALLWQQAAE